MIQLRNLKLPLSGGQAQHVPYDEDKLALAAARALKVDAGQIASAHVLRRSVDARTKGDVHFVVTAGVTLDRGLGAEKALVERLASANVALDETVAYQLPAQPSRLPDDPPVVVGAGAAGLFAALCLAECGLNPIVLERGADPVQRTADVKAFEASGVLDTRSNIQFGAGGAGTFSDGKLTTGTSAPSHRWILDAFVDAGAATDILWAAHPHVGSDVLPTVVGGLVKRIESLGGKVIWHARMTELVIEGASVSGVRYVDQTPCAGGEGGCCAREQLLPSRQVILATGHSARDTYAWLREAGVVLEPKVFSMGVRIEHPQSLVDRAQYKSAAGHPSLPAAEYKLSHHDAAGRGVYTFCMCPGGTVVAAASEEGGVVTNGMSEFARDGRNANSALLVNVRPEDVPGIADDVLAGVALQREVERAAFAAGGGAYVAPAQLLGDFIQGVASSAAGAVAPTYPRGVRWTNLEGVLPAYITNGMREALPGMARKLRGFDLKDAVLTGVESRSSAPVRITRGQDCQGINVRGLYPCGEGAGYAGGIMSAAADGLRCATALVESLG